MKWTEGLVLKANQPQIAPYLCTCYLSSRRFPQALHHSASNSKTLRYLLSCVHLTLPIPAFRTLHAGHRNSDQFIWSSERPCSLKWCWAHCLVGNKGCGQLLTLLVLDTPARVALLPMVTVTTTTTPPHQNRPLHSLLRPVSGYVCQSCVLHVRKLG